MGASALARLLDDLSDVIADVAPATYRADVMPGVSGSIGAHVRHVIDHVAALVTCHPEAPLSYDLRDRGTTIERDQAAALRRLAELRDALEGFALRSLDEPIAVSALVAPGLPPVVGWSSRARELAFVVSHTVHHQAIIAMLLATAGTGVPERFGYAASTPVAAPRPAAVSA